MTLLRKKLFSHALTFWEDEERACVSTGLRYPVISRRMNEVPEFVEGSITLRRRLGLAVVSLVAKIDCERRIRRLVDFIGDRN